MAFLTLAVLVAVRVGVSLRLHRLNEWLARWELEHQEESVVAGPARDPRGAL